MVYFGIVEAKEEPYQMKMAAMVMKLSAAKKELLSDGISSFDAKVRMDAARLMFGLEQKCILAMKFRPSTSYRQGFFHEHCNINVQYHMGWLPRANVRNLIGKTTVSRGFVLGSMGTRYRLLPFKPQYHLAQYTERHRLASAMIHSASPKTFDEYKALVSGVRFHIMAYLLQCTPDVSIIHCTCGR